jgi:hypothetical protein
MKKLLLLSAFTMTFAGLASASITFVTPCVAFEGTNSGAVASTTCSATADAGFFIDSVTLTITSDYTGYVSGSPVVTDVYTFNLNDAGFGAIPNGIVTTNGTNNSVSTMNFNSTVTGDFGSLVRESFFLSNSVAGGVVAGTSGVMTLTATESAIVTPEPATLGLVGGALLGLGFMSRRKKRSPSKS